MSVPGPDSLAVAREVDALCDRYEEARRRGAAGPLEDWLPVGGPLRAAALVELVRLEFEHRLQAGENVRAEDYFNRYPELRADAALAGRLRAAERRLRPDAGPTVEPGETRLTAPPSSVLPGARQLPEKFGRYCIIKVLGQGGMGTVYQARDTKLDRLVALKVMRFGTEDPDRVERFYREARIAASFTHPNLCPVYDAGQRDGVHYLTMPLLAGEPLSDHLQRTGRMPEQAAAALAASIARAVHEAHRAGVLHRDLKPANVMINERQQPVVLDFGLARRCGPLDPRATAPGVLLGTPAYMAPEQVAGGADTGGPSQDVYSLGVVLYEMLTGRLPFVGTLSEILTQVLLRAPEPPSRHRPGLDPQLERVCLTALAKDPKERFPSMEAFAESLEACATTPPCPPLRRGGEEGCPAPRTPRRRLALVGLLLGLAGLGGGTASVVAWSLNRPARVTAGSSTPTVANAPATTPPARQPGPDGFQAGSDWRGTFQWVGIQDPPQKVKVEVKERNGEHFRGVYTAQGGDYVWDIEGTIKGANVEWKFTAIVHEKGPKQVVGIATVEGRIEGQHLDATFRDAESRAKLSLDLWK